MLTNSEIRDILSQVEAGTYTVDDALNDIATAQRGEDVRKALYAEAVTLNKEGKVGATDLTARGNIETLRSDLNTAVNQTVPGLISEIEETCDGRWGSYSNRNEMLFPKFDEKLTGPMFRKVVGDINFSEAVGQGLATGDIVYDEVDPGITLIKAGGAVTIDVRKPFLKFDWTGDYSLLSLTQIKGGTLSTRIVVANTPGTYGDTRSPWNGRITIYNTSSSNLDPTGMAFRLVALFARKDLVTESSTSMLDDSEFEN